MLEMFIIYLNWELLGSLSIQPFSAGVKREHSFSCEIPILENEREHTPDRVIQTNSFSNFYEEVKYIGQVACLIFF